MSETMPSDLPGAPTGPQKAMLQTGPGLKFRNALPEWDHVPSRIVAEGSDTTPPLVTIAITTFRRSALLVEAIGSALRQQFDRPYEIIILDNDPASQGAPALMAAVPELAERSFRYFINGENFGVFGNFNRCIQLARGEWLTILNDDDMLDDDYLDLMFREIDRRPSIDGIVCHKRYIDNLAQSAEGEAATPQQQSHQQVKVNPLRQLLRKAGIGVLVERTRQKVKFERKFKFQVARQVMPRTFFWGAMLGNGGGFLFRRHKAIEIGGFYPEEYPSADFWFFARFAKCGELRQHRVIAASIRKTPGSITLGSVTEQLRVGCRLQQTLVGTETPKWWGLILPIVISHGRTYFIQSWGVTVPIAEMERIIGIRLPPDRWWIHNSVRFLLGGEY